MPAPEGVTIARRMADQLAHRGPDDNGVWADAGVALANTRLSILDLSEAGRQPMCDSRYCIVYNGEVYNFREIAEELRQEDPNLVLRSQSDTEVILKAYARWGRQCVHRLRGMFAFAIWDRDRQELFVARDRLGIKPLYYYADESLFLFASEVRALLASGVVRARLDPSAVAQYLTYQSVPAPRTLIAGVRAMPPGTWMTIDRDGAVRQEVYWDLLDDASQEPSQTDPILRRRRLRDLLRESAALHMVSDVPVGLFLSGGVDSSALVSLIRDGGHLPRTFTVVFVEREFDERQHARHIARRFRSDHSEILLREGDLLDQLPDALASMDQVSGDAVNTFLISSAVRARGMKVALSGLGGDEFFAGYPSFARLRRAAVLLRQWAAVPQEVRAFVGRAVRGVTRATIGTEKIASLLESDGSLPSALLIGRQVLSPAQRHTLLSDRWSAAADTGDPYDSVLARAFQRHPRAGLLAKISFGEARTYMHDVLLRDTDQMSMARGLEVRVPLLDHRLVEYVMGLPDDDKRPRGVPKRLLLDSLPTALPAPVVNRRKHGFALPLAPWMRGHLRAFCAARLGPERLGGRGIFAPGRLQEFWQAFLNGESHVSWSRLWILVTLEEWIERNGVETAL